ncbi:epoxide hydrolase family protein [Blastococcus saxobsidens]|nr:epoxide hydrolase family protein [Blastococcus saxobsidens]
MPGVARFTISVPDEDVDDLRRRLRATRWPDRPTVGDWSQGVPLEYVQELCRYWADDYDWPTRQARLNAVEQYTTDLNGVPIHVLHAPSPHPAALPLVLTHGWPGSVAEFLDVLGPLTDPTAHGGDPRDAFTVVVPSLPGFGWSGKPTEPGWGLERVADAWAVLMSRLGYERFGAQGGDLGSFVSANLAARHPDRLVGIHLNMVVTPPPADQTRFTEREERARRAAEHFRTIDSAYNMQQRTRPQTLAYGLADSPAAQCAWILEKFWSWSDCAGDPVSALGADRILDHVATYWLTDSAGSSARMYWEMAQRPASRTPTVTVPTGVSLFPHEIMQPTEEWARAQYRDLRMWHEHDRGGHFAAMEQPEALVRDIREFFRPLR